MKLYRITCIGRTRTRHFRRVHEVRATDEQQARELALAHMRAHHGLREVVSGTVEEVGA